MTRADKEEDVSMRKRICRRTEKDGKEEEASKWYFRNSLCSLVTEEEKDRMMIRWGEGGLRRSCTGTRLMRTVKRRTAEDEEEEEEEEEEGRRRRRRRRWNCWEEEEDQRGEGGG